MHLYTRMQLQKGGRVDHQNCPNHPNGANVHCLLLSLPSQSAVKISLCSLHIGFIPVNVQNRSCGGLCHKYPISFAILTTVGICYLVLWLLQHPQRTHRHLNASCGKPYTAKGSLRSLAIWGQGGSPYHQQFGSGTFSSKLRIFAAPISQGTYLHGVTYRGAKYTAV